MRAQMKLEAVPPEVADARLRQQFGAAVFHAWRVDPAAALWRRSTDAVSKRSLRSARDAGESLTGEKKSEAEQESGQFLALIKTAKRLAPEGRQADATASAATFQFVQWALGSEAGRSVAQMAARGAKRDPKLTALVREQQDLITEWQKRDAARNAALGMPLQQRNANAEAERASRLAAIDTRVAEIDKRLQAGFPDYAALANPLPLSIEEAQGQLHPDEALVLFLSTTE